jgi:hypothetical protein
VLDSCFTESAAASGRYTELGIGSPEESQTSITREEEEEEEEEEQQQQQQ